MKLSIECKDKKYEHLRLFEGEDARIVMEALQTGLNDQFVIATLTNGTQFGFRTDGILDWYYSPS